MSRFIDEVEITVTPQTGAYVNGIAVTVAGTAYSLMASVQPAPGSVIDRLPEGQRESAKYVLRTDEYDTLNYLDRDAGTYSDVITVDAVDYYLVGYENWTRAHGAISHNKFIMVEVTSE